MFRNLRYAVKLVLTLNGPAISHLWGTIVVCSQRGKVKRSCLRVTCEECVWSRLLRFLSQLLILIINYKNNSAIGRFGRASNRARRVHTASDIFLLRIVAARIAFHA